MESGSAEKDDVNLFGTWDASNIQQSGGASRGVFRQQNSSSPSLQVGDCVFMAQGDESIGVFFSLPGDQHALFDPYEWCKV